jgi:hypothetical protein
MPILIREQSNYIVSNFEFNSASLGVHFDLYKTKYIQFILSNRLQIPVSSSKDVKIKSGFSFDGVIGLVYFLSPEFASSVSWGGQYHRFDYNIDGSDAKYSLFISKINILLGYNFGENK